MKFDPPPPPDPPTPQHLAELGDAQVSATELQRLYNALARHPRVRATPGSAEIFESCRLEIAEDLSVLNEQLAGLRPLSATSPTETDEAMAAARPASFPDVQPADPEHPVMEAVRRAFQLEDFLRQQLSFAMASARQRRHRKLELQLKMMVLSTNQRCRMLGERYGFARSENPLLQEMRRQTTRFLSKLQGEERHDLD